VTVTVTLRNTDGPVGSRVSFVMLSRQAAAATEAWPQQWLPVHGFTKVHDVAAGGAATVVLTITARDLSRWDAAAHAFAVCPGVFELRLRDAEPPSDPLTLTVTP
jgi:hypothetical protein